MAAGLEDRAGGDDRAFTNDAEGADVGGGIDLGGGRDDGGGMNARRRARPEARFEHAAEQGERVGRIGDAEESLAGGRLARESDRHEDRARARGGHGVGILGVTEERKVGGSRFGQGGDTGDRTGDGALDGFGAGEGGEFGDGEGSRHGPK